MLQNLDTLNQEKESHRNQNLELNTGLITTIYRAHEVIFPQLKLEELYRFLVFAIH
jgi:hypothetical protein